MRTCLVASKPVSMWLRRRTLTSATASTQPIWWLVWLGSLRDGSVIVSGHAGTVDSPTSTGLTTASTMTLTSLWPSALSTDLANGTEDVPCAPFGLAAGGRFAAVCIQRLGERSKMNVGTSYGG